MLQLLQHFFRDGCNMLQIYVSVSKMIIIKNVSYNNISVIYSSA